MRRISPAARLVGLVAGAVCIGASACNGATSVGGQDSTGADTSPSTATLEPTTASSVESSTGAASVADTSTSIGTGAESSSSSGGTGSGEASSSAGSDPESSSDGGGTTVCPTADLGAALPTTVLGNTFGEADDFDGSCGTNGGPDLEYTFTAPAAGAYTFDTHGSSLNTVLYVLDGECDGSELACNDNGDGAQSALAVELAAGQSVTIVVDSISPGGAPFVLRAREGSFLCPLEDLGNTVPVDVGGDTLDGYRSHQSSCGGGAGPDAGYVFTAPEAGAYTFDTFGSSFASILTVRDGTCDGAELACGYDGVLTDLDAGQSVVIVVDSSFASGPFGLHIDTLGGPCPDSDLGNTVPQTVPGDTSDGDNTEAGSCGGAFSADDLYLFTAPQDGLYSFDTFGSALDTVVYLRDGGCGGPQRACNDDFSPDVAQSRVVEGLSGGESVLVAVDGNGNGSYALNVDLVQCPDDALSQVVPQDVVGNTSLGIDKLHGSCSAGGFFDESPDHAYSFTAPADGEYTFDTFGSGYDTLLYVLDGSACNGSELGCSDNFPGDQTSGLSLQLVAGQDVTVVVDGNFGSNGPFDLHVGRLDGGPCPDADLGNALPNSASGDTSDGDNTVAGSCGGFTQPDDTYLFTAAQDGLYTFDTLGADYDTVVFVRDGGCGGPELACNDDFSFLQQSLVAVGLAAGQTVMVAVDGGAESGTYDLAIDFVSCPDADLDSDLPESIDGTTIGAIDKLSMVGCGQVDVPAPDYVFEWTAPAAGAYTIDLAGSDYDTVLYVQDAACGGDELACNDDSIGLASLVDVNLAADQTVVIVISGYSGSVGNFTLNIN
jgi:hypothetical protein